MFISLLIIYSFSHGYGKAFIILPKFLPWFCGKKSAKTSRIVAKKSLLPQNRNAENSSFYDKTMRNEKIGD